MKSASLLTHIQFHQQDTRFPDPTTAPADAPMAVGGDLSPQLLLDAYYHGIFPWYEAGEVIKWWSPDPRFVLDPTNFVPTYSLARQIRNKRWQVTIDSVFPLVIEQCAAVDRPGQDGTWITREMIAAYIDLHELGYCHSFETWFDGVLVGGLYGLSLGNAFFGESMFFRKSNASKIAFSTMVEVMKGFGGSLIDCQIYTDHLYSLGARQVERSSFLLSLAASVSFPTRQGKWSDLPTKWNDR